MNALFSRTSRAYWTALAAWALSFALALKIGSVPGADFDLIYQLRLPRAILASAVGAGLAIAGAALQALFSNPLCEPYTIGISAGATLGTVVGAVIGTQLIFMGISGLAFVGALVFAVLLLFVARRSTAGSSSLLLAGVMLQFFGASLVSLWMVFADPTGIQGALSWLLGDLSRARLDGAVLSLALVLILSFFLWMDWRALDAFLIGEESALALGVDTHAARRRIIFFVSILVGACVSVAGMVGFVGLLIPHLVRRQVGSLHFSLLPLCVVWGAASLTFADSLARFVARPYELPVGVVTALIGAPFFLWLVMRRGAAA
ncbi:MAG: iron ABC transporter permease [Oligoflexia bacterium]|nr:iron ABC transporter permease [Oligoflexia bacterium]